MPPLIHRVLRSVGLDPSGYHSRSLQRRVQACLRQLRAADGPAALARLERNPALAAEALDSILIGVSDFFRDLAVFDQIRERILPELAGRDRLRVLSAGCSEGQELYSLALLLEEARLLDRSELLGVDCRPRAIEHARAGLYESPLQERLRALRERLDWRVADLFTFEDVRRFDLICFRNVAIYLREAGPVWRRLLAHLTPGGFLVTGKAEKPPAELPLRRIVPCLYRLDS